MGKYSPVNRGQRENATAGLNTAREVLWSEKAAEKERSEMGRGGEGWAKGVGLFSSRNLIFQGLLFL